MFIAALSNAAIVIFAPLWALRLIAIRDRRDAIIVAAFALGVAIQLAYSVGAPVQGEVGTHLSPLFAKVFAPHWDWSRLANPVRTAYGVTEIASKTVRPDFYPLGFFYPRADRYLAAVRAFGSMGYSAAELRTRSARTRFAADKVLVNAERLRLRATPEGRTGAGKPPRVAIALRGTARGAGGCLSLRPARGAGTFVQEASIPPPPSSASAAPPALAELTLPRGGVLIEAERLGAVAVRVGRFANVPRVPLVMPRAGRFASLPIPKDRAALPWKLIVYAPEPLSVCGLGP